MRGTAKRIFSAALALTAAAILAPAAEAPRVPSAFEQAGRPSEQERTGFAERKPRYRIQPNDVLDISFRFTPEFDQTVTVQPDGFIPLVGAGDLYIVSMTVEEARAAARKTYAAKLKDPVITMRLKEFRKPFFIVGGRVQKPGRYELDGEVLLTEAIQMAGGFSKGANRTQVLLFRRASQRWSEVRKIDVKHTLLGGGFAEDVLLNNGDSIFVSSSKLGKFSDFIEAAKVYEWLRPLYY